MKKNKQVIMLIIAIFLLCFLSINDVFSSDKQGTNDLEKIKSEFREKHINAVKRIKAELPELLYDLKNGNPQQRSETARHLGFSEDSRSIIPLAEVVVKDNSPFVRRSAIYGLLHTAYRKEKIPQFNELLKKEIIPALKKAMKSKDKTVKKAAAEVLYRVGEKIIALEIIDTLAKSGDIGIFGIFFYVPELSNEDILVGTLLPDKLSNPLVKTERKIDQDAYPFLLGIIDSSCDVQLKIKSLEIIFRYNIADKQFLIPYLRDIVINSEDLDSIVNGMGLLYKIGTPESKEILREASNIEEIKSYAIHYLDYWRKKRK